MKRWYLLLVAVSVALAAVVALIVWPHNGGQHATALTPVKLHPRDVRGLPVLWLGDSYDSKRSGTPDMPLTGAEMNDSPEFRDPRNGQLIHPETKWYSMGYGTCTRPTPRPGHEQQSGCSIPTINIYDVCGTPPFNTTGMPRVRIRGVDAVEFSPGGLWVETADFTISVDAWGKTLAEGRANARQMVEDLIGANPQATVFAKGAAFRPLDEAAVQRRCSQPAAATAPVATIAIGTPSRVSQTVQVPINVSGTVDGLGFNVHLRWDPAVFTFSSANAAGSIIPSPFCAQSIDTDGAGIVYGCATTGVHATQTGLLATIVLTPASSGCSTLHLVTFGDPDAGDSGNGTYLMAPDNTPQAVSYGPDIRVDVNALAC